MEHHAVSRLGVLSGQASGTQVFLDRVLDRATGRLRLEQRGRIWEAVATARRLGGTGAGRLVAVVDGGLDLSVPTLARGLHASSRVVSETVAPTSGHGTAVALLIREMAPECELLLLDVYSDGSLRPEAVADALTTAYSRGADVINLSLQFSSDCPQRDTDWIRPELLTSLAPPVEEYAEQVDAWIANAEPYASGRCQSACPICDALASAPESTLAVAASGNWEGQSCPACFDRAVGVGFQRTRRVERNGSIFTISELPVSSAPVGRAELLVEEPPGFLGTSFAAPLLSGLAATVAEPADLAVLSRMSRALTPILALAGTQWATPPENIPEDAPMTLHRGLIRIAEAMPERHRHFDQVSVSEPCPLCVLLLVDWYDVFVSMLVASDNPRGGLDIARIASVLAPDTASISGNRGLAAERTGLREEALAAYQNAANLAPDVDIYSNAVARLKAP